MSRKSLKLQKMRLSILSRYVISAFLVLGALAFLRLLYILPGIRRQRRPRSRQAPNAGYARVLVVLGSGGHTSEMIAMLRGLDTKLFAHRSYVVGEGDNFSARAAADFEESLSAQIKDFQGQIGSYDIEVVPRARKIHQPLFTTPFSALRCLWACLGAIRRPQGTKNVMYPDLVVTNGPGTAVCAIVACLILKYLGARGTQGKMRSVYVESWARVKRLSLSGRILLVCVDRFIVQWESLKHVSPRAEYHGMLV